MATDRVRDFLEGQGWGEALGSPVAAGASTRQLTRLVRADGARGLLMDTGGQDRKMSITPYEQTIMPDLRPFARVARLLRSLGFSAPEVLAESEDGHLLLVEDFGETELIRLLRAGADPVPLFALAVDTLLELQRRFMTARPDMRGLRTYTPDFFLSHLAVIPDVYLPLLCGQAPPAEVRDHFLNVWRVALTRACATPHSLMLRDFAISNAFHLPDRAGVNAMGLIDFETAGTGPVIYDLASILRDNRFPIPAAVVAASQAQFLKGFPDLNPVTFDAAYHIFAAMRQVQWAGSCALYTTQGRPGFLANLPGIWALVEDLVRHPALHDVGAWFETHIPPSARRDPAAA